MSQDDQSRPGLVRANRAELASPVAGLVQRGLRLAEILAETLQMPVANSEPAGTPTMPPVDAVAAAREVWKAAAQEYDRERADLVKTIRAVRKARKAQKDFEKAQQDLLDRLGKEATEATEELRTSQAEFVPSPKQWNAIAGLAIAEYETMMHASATGVVTFSEWAAEAERSIATLRPDIGERIRPLLRRIWATFESERQDMIRYYQLRRDYAGVIAALSKAIDLDPNEALAYERRGNAYYEIGDYRQCLDDYKKAADACRWWAERCFQERKYHLAGKNVNKCQALGGRVNPDFLKALQDADWWSGVD